MPGVEGQWDFYPNLRLKIKHTLVNVELFTPHATDGGAWTPRPPGSALVCMSVCMFFLCNNLKTIQARVTKFDTHHEL